MKTNRRVSLLAFLALTCIALMLLLSCSGSQNAETASVLIRTVGSAQNSARSTSDLRFASAFVTVGSRDVTEELRAVNPSAVEGSGVEFSTTVSVEAVDSKVEYRLESRNGFVFDEWEVDRAKVKADFPDSYRTVLKEIYQSIDEESETITIKHEYVKYLIATFERGFYASSQDEFNAKLASYISSMKEDDEITIKLSSSLFSLDLSAITDSNIADDIEINIIGGYDGASWNLTGERTRITDIKFPNVSGGGNAELTLRNLELESLNLSSIGTDVEIENCLVKTLTGSGDVISNLVIGTISGGVVNENTVFINADAPYYENATYYHSIIRGDNITLVKGKNNIVVASGSDDDNIYLPDFGTGYKKRDSTLIERLKAASPLKESEIKRYEEYLEEDIEGRDRLISESTRDDQLKVSYGPYEYIYFND